MTDEAPGRPRAVGIHAGALPLEDLAQSVEPPEQRLVVVRITRHTAQCCIAANIEVLCDDAASIFERGPFDVLVHDGGPGSGKSRLYAGRSAEVLRPGGTMTVDDHMPTTTWPPRFGASVDESRVHWLEHPQLRSREVRVAPDLAVIVCRYPPGEG